MPRPRRWSPDRGAPFCFVRPIYADKIWKPARLEYGVFKMPPHNALDFWGAEFGN
jgi:hypothetical protein